MAASGDISAVPWRAADAQPGSHAPGMLGLEERKLLYHLARNIYRGEGAVVELGAFCGSSTCCLAAGLRDNPLAAGRRIHSYDNFTASETYLVDFIRNHFGRHLRLGESFAAIFHEVTAPFADLIETHPGDLLAQHWPVGVPIEILFVDVAKTLALSAKVLTEFFPHLTPAKSIVVHQDFYHPTAFYLPVVMDFLMDHFSIIETGRDWSVVFRIETAIPQEKLQLAGLYKFSYSQQHAAFRRMMRRLGAPGRDYLRLSECAAIGTYFGERWFRRALATAIRRAEHRNDQVWSDGVAWCRDFRANHIRTRLYGNPSMAPAPAKLDKACLIFCGALAAISERIGHRRQSETR
jgi:hypothetical protein